MRLPHVYVAPLGLPLHWHDEQSGVLIAAVMAFFDESMDSIPATREQLALVVDYISYYLGAPCWCDVSDQLTEIQDMCRVVAVFPTAHDIREIIHKCLEIGIDPL